MRHHYAGPNPDRRGGSCLSDARRFKTFAAHLTISFINLAVGAGAGIEAANEVDPTIQTLLNDIPHQNALESLITGTPGGPTFPSVRCNFYPTYVTPDPTQFGGKPQPVCELVVRAKRLNVFPDTVELVWFDGAATNNVSQSELSVEGFADYLLTLRAGGALCTRQEYTFANGFGRRFAHVSRY